MCEKSIHVNERDENQRSIHSGEQTSPRRTLPCFVPNRKSPCQNCCLHLNATHEAKAVFTDQIVLNLIISTLFCIGVVHTGWGRWCIRNSNFSNISCKWEQYLRLLKPFPSIGDKTAEGRGAELDKYIQLKKTGNYAECECGTCFYTNKNLFQGLWKR